MLLSLACQCEGDGLTPYRLVDSGETDGTKEKAHRSAPFHELERRIADRIGVFAYMRSMMAEPNSEQLTSVEPLIIRARS